MSVNRQQYLWSRTHEDLSVSDIALTEKEAEIISSAQIAEPLEPDHILWCLGHEEMILNQRCWNGMIRVIQR